MNAVVDKMRRAAIKEASHEDLLLLKNSCYLLLKSQESLDATGETKLRELMARNRKLHTAYARKEESRAVLRQRHGRVTTWSIICRREWLSLQKSAESSYLQRVWQRLFLTFSTRVDAG